MRTILALLFLCIPVAKSQAPPPQDAVEDLIKLFDTYRIVMLGEIHGCRQEYDFLNKLVSAPGFAERVNDIVVEFGNAGYQEIVDRYIAGENVRLEQVEGAWRDTAGALGPVSPVYGEFYSTVRAANRKLPKQRRLRVLLGDPPLDWSRVTHVEDLAPYLPFRDEFYAGVVRYKVLAEKHRALLIMGEGHFRRSARRPGAIENELLMSLVKPYVILPGSNMVGGYYDLDSRFDALPAPTLVAMKGNWIGALPAAGRGAASTLEQTADAYLYLGPRDRITVVKNRRSDLEGTAYGNELARRLKIIFGQAPDFLPPPDAGAEQPAFSRAPAAPPPLPKLPPPHP